MVIVRACEDRSPNQLPAWTSHSFAVFLEGNSAGLPPSLGSPEGFLGSYDRRPGRSQERHPAGDFASLEVRFFFDSRTTGSIALRKDAPERCRDSHFRGCPDVDRRDGIVPVPPTEAVCHLCGSFFC